MEDRTLDKALADYVYQHSTPPNQELKNLERETWLKTLAPQMIAGAYQGQLLRMLSCMIRPNKVLEIGTFTGYSALCLVEGIPDSGELHSIEVNEERESLIRKYFEASPHKDKLILHIGDALDLIPKFNTNFDLVYLDAGKMHYSLMFDLVFEKLNPGGYIIADNVLWDVKVLDTKEHSDERTSRIDQFNKKVQNDPRVENILLPLRDGLMIARKLP